jgi:hypothetical protein
MQTVSFKAFLARSRVNPMSVKTVVSTSEASAVDEFDIGMSISEIKFPKN